MQAAQQWGDRAVGKLTIMKGSTQYVMSQRDTCPGHQSTASPSEILLKQLAGEHFT